LEVSTESEKDFEDDIKFFFFFYINDTSFLAEVQHLKYWILILEERKGVL